MANECYSTMFSACEMSIKRVAYTLVDEFFIVSHEYDSRLKFDCFQLSSARLYI